jgi:hypothetical protein
MDEEEALKSTLEMRRCHNCGTYNFYSLTEDVSGCKLCSFPVHEVVDGGIE